MKRVAAAVATLSSMASLAGGQPRRIVQGVVSDGSNRPVPLCAVLVAGVGAAISDDSGRFQLEIPHNEKILLDVRHVGYMLSRFLLGPGGDTTLDVLILQRPTQLPTVDITSSRLKPPSLAGFEQRMADRKRGAGTGQFITAADIAKLTASRPSEILETVPSISVRRTGGSGSRSAVYGRSAGRSQCAATVFLDGIRLGSNGVIDDYVLPTEIAGIEIYQRGLLAPAKFQSALTKDQSCAVIVVWTKFR